MGSFERSRHRENERNRLPRKYISSAEGPNFQLFRPIAHIPDYYSTPTHLLQNFDCQIHAFIGLSYFFHGLRSVEIDLFSMFLFSCTFSRISTDYRSGSKLVSSERLLLRNCVRVFTWMKSRKKVHSHFTTMSDEILIFSLILSNSCFVSLQFTNSVMD